MAECASIVPQTLTDCQLAIRDFVHEPRNRRLRAGTGYYSVPFRGRLFDHAMIADVERELPHRRVDLLWLGTNPNVPSSVRHILDGGDYPGDYPTFERQIESGLLGASRDGRIDTAWNPLQRPTGTWRVYRDAFASVLDPAALAMVNYFPWGSANLEELLQVLGRVDDALRERVCRFADELNDAVLTSLRPKLLVVPFSLGRSRSVARVGLHVAHSRTLDVEESNVATTGQPFRMFTGRSRRQVGDLPVLLLRHPSSLKFSVEDRKRIGEAVAAAVGRLAGTTDTREP